MGETHALRLLLRIYVVLFGAGALVFLFLARPLVQLLNGAGKVFGMPGLDAGYAQFAIPLAVAYMVVVMELAWAGQRDRTKSRAVDLLILAKATSALVALGYFLLVLHAFAFLANFLVDAVIAVVTYLLHRQAPAATASRTT